MTTLSIQSGKSSVSSSFIAHQLEWFENVIDTRLKLYFGQDCAYHAIENLVNDNEEEQYFQLFQRHFSFADKVFLWLTLSPVLKPQLLDYFYVKNQDIDNRFSEFGTFKPAQLNALLPTFDTLLFILAAENIADRIRYMNYFNRDHFFLARNFISFETPSPTEPFTASVLVSSNDLTELVMSGKEYAPEFSHSFPAKKLLTPMDWSDLVLPERILVQIEEIKTWVEKGEEMMDKLELRTKIKPGYRSLFCGPPGTGKTLTAALLGKHTGYDVYRIDLSLIVSKYIGETEKNLTKIFDRAEHKKWILFFDEADALFGKRTQVKDAHDRYANQEVSFLLQRVEDYNGLIILATNLKTNIDEAFARRFQSIIDFPMPKAAERLLLWKNTFSTKTTFAENVDMDRISKDYEISGGSIINVVRYCSLLSVKRDDAMIFQEDIIEGIKREFLKEGKTI